MKKKTVVGLSVAGVIVLGVAFGGNEEETAKEEVTVDVQKEVEAEAPKQESESDVDVAEENDTKAEPEKKEEPKESKELTLDEKYSKIKQGDSLTGNGGMTKEEVIEIMGQPESTSTTKSGDLTLEVHTWMTDSFEMITVTFTNGHVSGKSMMK